MQTKDMLGRHLEIKMPPQRIVSVVPSQTELLADLGLTHEVLGITKFCIHPNKWFRNKTRVGGTKNLRIETIHVLQPDLIIANKEENDKTQIEALAQDYPVWISDIYNLEDAYQMISQIGAIVQKVDAAKNIVKSIRQSFADLEITKQLSAAYLIWKNPYMVVASGTFIDEMLNIAGFKNVYTDAQRYPVVTLEELAQKRPSVLLLSSEPYPFKEKDIATIQTLCPQAIIELVDGELFSWYGSRLKKSVGYFQNLHLKIKKRLKC